MTSGKGFEDWESSREVLMAIRTAGFTLSPSQLARRHRVGLIVEPTVRHLGYGRGTISLYPSGTAARLTRTLQVAGKGDSFQDVAWRVWWQDGGEVTPLVRRRLQSEASRWEDELSRLANLLEREEAGDDEAEQEMEQAYEAAAKERLPKSLGRLRRIVGAENFATVFRVLAEVAAGRFGDYADAESELLVERALQIDRARNDHFVDGTPWFEGRSAEDFAQLSSSMKRDSLRSLAESASSDLDTARQELGALWEVVLMVVPIYRELYSPGAFGFDVVGELFDAQPERDQPFLLLMWAGLRKNPRLRDGMAEIAAVREEALTANRAFTLISALRKEVPALAEVMSGKSMADALRDEASSEELDKAISAIRDKEGAAIESFFERHPEFATTPTST